MRNLGIICGLVFVAAVAPTASANAQSTAAPVAGSLPSPALVSAWQRVTQAQTWMQQANEVNAFIRVMAAEGFRPSDLTMDARDIASGRAVAADDLTLLQRPQAHEVTLTLDGRFYVFRPLARASLEPLIRR